MQSDFCLLELIWSLLRRCNETKLKLHFITTSTFCVILSQTTRFLLFLDPTRPWAGLLLSALTQGTTVDDVDYVCIGSVCVDLHHGDYDTVPMVVTFLLFSSPLSFFSLPFSFLLPFFFLPPSFVLPLLFFFLQPLS